MDVDQAPRVVRHKAWGQNPHEACQHHQIWRMHVNSFHQCLIKGFARFKLGMFQHIDVLEHAQFESREAFDQALMKRIDVHAPDLVVLAGFMRILTPGFVAHYAGRLINIHPSLLPAFTGLNTHQRAIDARQWHVDGCSAP